MPVVVKVVTSEQSDALAQLWQSSNSRRREEQSLPPLDFEVSVLDRPGSFAVGVFDGPTMLSVAVAMPALADDGRSSRNVPGLAHISSVATVADRWGQGLATQAMAALLMQCTRRGYARAELSTHATNVPALRLYTREGFVPSGRARVDGDGEPIAHLVRELPAYPVVNRAAARVLCHDDDDRILLMHWRDSYDGHEVWEPPGGGIEPGEDPVEAVLREWHEETGLAGLVLDPRGTAVGRDTYWSGRRLVADEWFFRGRVAGPTALAPAALTASEQVELLGWEWLRVDELTLLDAEVVPDLPPILARLP